MVKVKNKRGWIKVLEAFISIMLLLGLLLVIANFKIKNEGNEGLMIKTNSLIETIRLNDSLRNQVISQQNLPISSNEDGFSLILNKTLELFNLGESYCILTICNTRDLCELDEDIKKEIYAKESLFFGNESIYSPRKLKVFCIRK